MRTTTFSVIVSLLLFLLVIISDQTYSLFIDNSSVSVRNARWLEKNDLTWYNSHVPDVMTMLNAASEDDEKPGFDPGSWEQLDQQLKGLCKKANTTFMSMNLSRDCATDLRFLACSGAYLAMALGRLSSSFCQKQKSPASCNRLLKEQIQLNLWSSKYLDSFGKASAGWLTGNYMHLGSYQQCTQLNVKRPKEQSHFNGKFCYATFSLPLSATRAKLATSCYGRDYNQSCAPVSNKYTVKWGFCMPKSCSIREANGLAYYILHVSNMTLCPARPLVMCIDETPLRSDATAITMTVICILLALLVATATIIDLVNRNLLTREWLGCFGGNAPQLSTVSAASPSTEFELQENSRRSMELLLSFSIYTNLKTLLDTDDPKRSSVRCLDGIRVLTMAWIILSQSVVLLIDYVGNLVAYLQLPASLSFQAVNNSSFSTDTFFFIGGFLSAIAWLKNSPEREDRQNITKSSAFSLLRRLLRILPVYVFIVAVATAFWARIGEGPMWATARYSHSGPFYCQFTWWTNLLFVNNFLYLDYPCMPSTWHVAVDVQLYLLAIPILILYRKRPLAGFLASVVLIVLSMILTGIVVGSFALPPSLLATKYLSRIDSLNMYYDKIYIKPYMRWNAHLIGIFFGYVFCRTERNRNAMGLNYLRIKPINVAAWALIVLICSTLVYSLHGYASGGDLTTAVVVVYAAISRTLWSLAIGILILLCLRTNEGLVTWFLSWSLWTPLSRLTYCAFLLHSLSIVFLYGTAKEWLEFSYGNMIYFWLSSLSVSYGLGLVAYICVEAPAVRIGRLFFPTGAHNPTNNAAGPDSFKLLKLDTTTTNADAAR